MRVINPIGFVDYLLVALSVLRESVQQFAVFCGDLPVFFLKNLPNEDWSDKYDEVQGVISLYRALGGGVR